jgi:guanosine-3',5'-bis(diphosphate) 3'-pyrophosphohydrolase
MLIEKASAFARRVHNGQTRLSGDPYVEHPEAVAGILAGLGLDETTIAAGYLHDVLEDTDVGYNELEGEFGTEVAELVKAVTRLEGMGSASDDAYRDADLQEMFVAMAGDLRVVFVKFADRLDNLRTLGYLRREKRYEVARESLYLFAPLADRLGLGQLRWEIEDLAFRYLEPDVYGGLAARINERRSEREMQVESAAAELDLLLKTVGIEAEVTGRPKHLYSIWRKMVREDRPFEEIFDLLGVRIIVGTVADCYRVLDAVHSVYDYLEGRYRDYVVRPKPNMYQSLHTTVKTPAGYLLEVQIRTSEMHMVAEYGIAAHWLYKRTAEGLRNAKPPVLGWLGDAAADVTGGPIPELLEAFFADVVKEDIFVFTPAGDIKRLPKGATPVDFAYAVHTMVGNRCSGARVNGVMVPLRTTLRTGDRVEIITSPKAEPSRDWLEFAVSSSACSKIRGFFRKKDRLELISLGREALTRECERTRRTVSDLLADPALTAYAVERGHSTVENLLVRLGEGAVSPMSVISALYPPPERAKTIPVELPDYSGYITVAGLEGLELRMAGCCRPMPLVPIIGYVTAAGYVSIHRAGCSSLARRAPGRIHRASWVMDDTLNRDVSVRITVRGGRTELSEVVQSLESGGIRVTAVSWEPEPGDKTAVISLKAASKERLKSLRRSLDRNPLVSRVEILGRRD